MLHLVVCKSKEKEKEKEKKRNINNNLAVLPSHDTYMMLANDTKIGARPQ